MTLFDLDPEFPRERLFAMVEDAAHGPIPPFEARTLRRDGVYIPTEVSLARIDFGGAAYLFGVVRDITERKQIEAVQRSFARRMLENLETERQRVARELHDDVGQAVATVGVLLHTLAQTPGAVAEAMRPALQTHAHDHRRHDRVGGATLSRVSSGRAARARARGHACAPTSASSRAATASPAGSPRPRSPSRSAASTSCTSTASCRRRSPTSRATPAPAR